MTPIYLDNNATTKPDERVLDRLREVAATCYGNPGSPHSIGRKARQVLEDARESVAANLHAAADGVVFTSGATEASNLALHGLARGRGTFAAPQAEHPASEEVLQELESTGWRRQILTIDRDGQLNEFELADDVRLATIILAHNESGVIQDVTGLHNQCDQRRIPWHLDATQAIGKIPVDFTTLGCTTMSLSAHKFHGPRGIGCLIAKSRVTIPARNLGGHQESGRRGGTEAVALAAGLAKALQIVTEDLHENTQQIEAARNLLESNIVDAIPKAVIHGRNSTRLPNTSSIGFPGCDGQALLVALDLAGVCCSMGSACASGSPEPAPILKAMGVEDDLATASLRFSLSRHTTREDVATAAQRIISAVERQTH